MARISSQARPCINISSHLIDSIELETRRVCRVTKIVTYNEPKGSDNDRPHRIESRRYPLIARYTAYDHKVRCPP